MLACAHGKKVLPFAAGRSRWWRFWEEEAWWVYPDGPCFECIVIFMHAGRHDIDYGQFLAFETEPAAGEDEDDRIAARHLARLWGPGILARLGEGGRREA